MSATTTKPIPRSILYLFQFYDLVNQLDCLKVLTYMYAGVYRSLAAFYVHFITICVDSKPNHWFVSIHIVHFMCMFTNFLSESLCFVIDQSINNMFDL